MSRSAAESEYGACVQKELALKDAWLQHLMSALTSVTGTTTVGNIIQVRRGARAITLKMLVGDGAAN